MSSRLRYERGVLVVVFVGGCFGALARASLLELFPPDTGEWPWATLIANLAGAFALGIFATLSQQRESLSAHRKHLLETGLCGALTTFSTMQLELVRMLEDSALALATGYAATSIAAGLLAITLATRHVRRGQAAG